MATLVRPQTVSHVSESRLAYSIPKPFPSRPERERLLRAEQLPSLSTQETRIDNNTDCHVPQDDPSQVAESSSAQGSKVSGDALHELMPSIAHVQKTCLMTLNNLLSAPTKWHPIVPDRRHSVPSHESSAVPQFGTAQSSSALLTLVSNLRNRSSGQVMVEICQSNNDTGLIHELRTHVEGLSSDLDPTDALLARTLISLIGHFDRLSVIHSTANITSDRTIGVDGWSPHEPAELYATLKRQLSDLQVERLAKSVSENSGKPPVLMVESALLWSQIDEELESLLSICKERAEGPPNFQAADHLPPQYDSADYQLDTPPEYDHATEIPTHTSESKSRAKRSPSSASGLNEKMRMDLEAVTMAIDRLYMVAPQLHNQRVELKSAKVEQMEQARRAGSRPSSRLRSQTITEGKSRDSDVREMEVLLDLLGKASDRKLTDQSVVLEGGMQTRLEKARLRDIQKRDAFVEQLVQHSSAGRLHSQDAILQSARTKDPDTLLTLPEFIRETLPSTVQMADPTTLLTLPEFVNEPVPEDVVQAARIAHMKSSKRSQSVPPLWLRTSSRATSFFTSSSLSSVLDVNYVAENHESLHHVLVFFTVTDAMSGVDIEAEVVPSPLDSSEGERLIIRSGLDSSLPLSLPARVPPGKQEVKVQSGHYEIKLTTHTAPAPAAESVSLLDASQLSISNPTSFICACCSLPVVQSAKIGQYKDLPSEHWEELVDAWMCHTDQGLHEHVAQHSRGFWPQPGQALVGGSYILFDESSIIRNNLSSADQSKERGDDWRLIRCLCGSVIGRCQERHSPDHTVANAYRLLKYAIRPVSPTAEPLKVPLSAFIVEDMIEFVQAHATYRFVIFDEEDERPRLLIWLFKPSIRLAYATPTQYAIPKTGSIHAAKVLYKIVGPSTASTDLKSILSKYPGFPQAEYLFYPIDICRRLAALLKESNTSYPESMRMMTGLEIGWLHRA